MDNQLPEPIINHGKARYNERAENDHAATSDMDVRIVPKRPLWRVIFLIIGVVLLLSVLVYLLSRTSGETLSVSQESIQISSVSYGEFEDRIPIRARLTPLITVFLDTTDGGRVEEVFVQNGDILEAGDPILRLSNPSLQLALIAREADVAEQQNSLASLSLDLQRNQLERRRQLTDISYNITRLERQISLRKPLAPDAVSQEEIDNLQDELAYNKDLLKLTEEARVTDALLQQQQAAQTQSSLDRLEQNLAVTRENLESLNVSAPIDGQLTAFSSVVGQSLSQGERIGRVDSPDRFKLVAEIDEFYLNRIDLGQRASVTADGSMHEAELVNIYPEVLNGRFQVDFKFDGEQPEDVRRGQTLQAQLTLGDATSSLLLPSGAFYQDSGGSWVFVVSENGQVAIRRPVRLGRRNDLFIEILDGLQEGETVVTSGYASYADIERLNIF